ncbi:MAG: DMT family transporter, partial [Longicatena sp.]
IVVGSAIVLDGSESTDDGSHALQYKWSVKPKPENGYAYIGPTNTNTFNFIYLGLGASATCFVTWNFAVKTLGALKTSIYIYLVPVVTIVTSFLILRENVTYITWIGAGLTILGLFLSESTCFRKK